MSESVEPFADNWTYLRAELNWLDRLLSVAVARQKKDTKEVDRLARTKADRATSHWWKGLVTLEGETAYDSPADMPRRKPGASKFGFQQQLDAKILATQQGGIHLGLPALCQRLQLSSFEKNLVLMALAPEINRRYSRIYSYLQEAEQVSLPSVDLILRLLCRTDAEWRSARQLLTSESRLIRHHCVTFATFQPEPFLTHGVKLAEPLVDYLLADQPSAIALDTLLERSDPRTQLWTPTAELGSELLWSRLLLPDSLLNQLRRLSDRIKFAPQVDRDWGLAAASPGAVALLVGRSGTGKTTAARTIAQAVRLPLVSIDLDVLTPADQRSVLHDLLRDAPPLVLLQSAQRWFGRTASLSTAEVNQFLAARCHQNSITCLSVEQVQTIAPHFRRRMHPILDFPIPDSAARLRLWKAAFPAATPLDATIAWETLAQRFVLTGGEIQTIAREAALLAAADQTAISTHHLMRVCVERAQPKKRG